jgi:hypothetical protein
MLLIDIAEQDVCGICASAGSLVTGRVLRHGDDKRRKLTHKFGP